MRTLISLALTAALSLALSPVALADDQGKPPSPETTQPKSPAGAPAMSEIPTMKEQGERMAILMERLTKETDPAERKRIMAEAICPQ